MKCKALIVAATALLGFAAPTHAAVIFSDDFERADSLFVGNGWLESQLPTQIGISSGGVELAGGNSSHPDGGLSRTISTLGFTSIILRYQWDHNGNTEDADTLLVEWKPSSSGIWNSLATHAGDQGGTPDDAAFYLAAIADDSSVDIRFVVEMNQADELFRLDDIRLEGTAIATVPEPGTLGLLGAGLAAFGWMRRRHHAPRNARICARVTSVRNRSAVSTGLDSRTSRR